MSFYRSWQELGYLIIYISGRLADLQKDYILKFLGCHGFPLGLLFCADSFSADAQSVKTAYLARLIKQASLIPLRYLYIEPLSVPVIKMTVEYMQLDMQYTWEFFI